MLNFQPEEGGAEAGNDWRGIHPNAVLLKAWEFGTRLFSLEDSMVDDIYKRRPNILKNSVKSALHYAGSGHPIERASEKC